MIDVNSLTLAVLKALRRDIDKALEGADVKAKQGALAAAQAAVASFGYALHDLLPWVTKSKRSSLPAKYQHPEEPTQTWSGRGRKPGWIKEAEAAGRDVADYLI